MITITLLVDRATVERLMRGDKEVVRLVVRAVDGEGHKWRVFDEGFTGEDWMKFAGQRVSVKLVGFSSGKGCCYGSGAVIKL